MTIRKPYLLYLGDAPDNLAIKMAQGVLDWRPDWCLAQWRRAGAGVALKLPEMTPEAAADQGAGTLVVGVVNAGGVLPEDWIDDLRRALEAGLDIAAGMHVRLRDVSDLGEVAARLGRTLTDLRVPDRSFSTGKGTRRPGKRVLTIGTDCSVGKKYAALALERGLRAAGADADFRATGQTGRLIAERGVAVDAVPADFIAGAAEWLCPAADPDHWDVVEGQGSLFHPSFAGVTLGLLHGAQPDRFVVCHEPTRTRMRGVDAALPTIAQVIETTLAMGRLTNADIAPAGICINTAALSEADARDTLRAAEDSHGLPATDPIRFGVESVVAELLR
ncbi:N-acetyltransferase DgcN [Jannaschia aquimarina]|nr:N-acetyltransferase DgcN [Jannaschia aquimarina]